MSTDRLSHQIADGLAVQLSDPALPALAHQFFDATARYRYTYRFSWLGLPIIQYPQDILAMQQLIWQVKPDLIIETGIAHGGSLLFYASMLELNALGGGSFDTGVVGVEIGILPETRAALESHRLSRRIVSMIEGSSISPEVIQQVRSFVQEKKTVLVCLDSNHTHAHVLAELEAYAPLVTPGSYCVVFDTVIEDMPADAFPDRPWGVGNNPKTAVREYLDGHPEFEVDEKIDQQLLISSAPGGYLRRRVT